MLKVADFGTSRFLEIAAHGTTVIGSPPYMAPEQFHGKAVFASDLYSLGVTMYQMLTGVLPYDTPAPADLDKLMSGELVSPPRLKNAAIPKSISDIVMKALAPETTGALPARLGPAGRRAGGAQRDADAAARRRAAGRRGAPRAAAAAATTRRASRAGCARAKRPRPGSAGSAASRCTRAPIAARSVTKSSDRAPP